MAIAARGLEELTTTAEELAAKTGQRVVPIVTDVTSREQVDRMTDQAAELLGGLHILVNSGALPGDSPTAVGHLDTVVDEDLLQDFKSSMSAPCAAADKAWAVTGELIVANGGTGYRRGRV